MCNLKNEKVTFIQYEIPPLKTGEYTVEVSQVVNQDPGTFTQSRQFVVSGERFAIDPSEIKAVYPENLARGEFCGIFPHVLFNRRTLPWERDSVDGVPEAAWLAVLLFNENELPIRAAATAKDLVAMGTAITVIGGGTKTETGTMPKGYLSYPGIEKLDYGESPNDKCEIIDIPIDIFNKIAPSAVDLQYLSHIREVDTTDSEDKEQDDELGRYAVVTSNRIPAKNGTSYVYLVSIENMGAFLPEEDGTPSKAIPPGTTKVRLIAYKSWSFIASDTDESFKSMVESLNKASDGKQGLSCLQLPIDGIPPEASRVALALENQAKDKMTDEDAEVLLKNAFCMGYVPHSHHLRHGGDTVSWYRGPFVPYPAGTNIAIPISCPDSANRYDPQTGMFDVSYGTAWQIGQLLALQNKDFASTLYKWKKSLSHDEALAAEIELINEKLKGLEVFSHMLTAKENALPPIPATISDWMGRLKLLHGVPMNYLVPDERMLPKESLHFFYLDFNWIHALADGAYSIGRATEGELLADKRHIERVMVSARAASKNVRKDSALLNSYENQQGQVTGILLRSGVMTGWPRVVVKGYSDMEGEKEIPKLRVCRLSDNILLCLFDGVVKMATVSEPPEHMHTGVESTADGFAVTCREVVGNEPGKQYLINPSGGSPDANIPVRGDNQTIRIKNGADNIMNKLKNDFKQNITSFTSAEYAMETTKGVVKVEFQNKN